MQALNEEVVSMILQKLLLIILSMSSLACAANEVSLQRLFTTAEERTLINQQKHQARIQSSLTGQEKPPVFAIADRISLDAVLLGSKKVVWVNRQLIDRPTTIAGIVVDPKHATMSGLLLLTPKGKKWLKQGQVYLTESGKVVERYEAI
jgi:hypothetical protein